MILKTRRSGFTLVELLIVIGIIAILMVLALGVANKVSQTGKTRATEQVVRVLDSALTEYIAVKGANPPATVLDPHPTNTGTSRYIWPVGDIRNMSSANQEMINSVGFFMLQCKGIPSVEATLKQIDSKFIHDYNPETSPGAGSTSQPTIPTIFDAWGHPIRYVHPAFKGTIYGPRGSSGNTPDQATDLLSVFGPATPFQYSCAQIRRNKTSDGGGPDSDGGIPPTSRPYFYSVGPDGDPSTQEDNIYIAKPKAQR